MPERQKQILLLTAKASSCGALALLAFSFSQNLFDSNEATLRPAEAHSQRSSNKTLASAERPYQENLDKQRNRLELSPETLGESLLAHAEVQAETERWDRFISEWAVKDFDAALAWTKKLKPSPLRERALLHLSYQWEERAPNDLLDFALSLPQGQDRLIVALANRWATQEPEEIANWAAGLPNTPRKRKILSSVVASWATSYPADALDFVALLPLSSAYDEARLSTLSALSIQEPELASQLVESFPLGSLRDKVIEQLAYHWIRANPLQAQNWIDSSLSQEERDHAALAGVGASIETDPKLSTLWANSIAQPKLRKTQLKRALRKWFDLDPSAAKIWIQETELPESWGQELL